MPQFDLNLVCAGAGSATVQLVANGAPVLANWLLQRDTTDFTTWHIGSVGCPGAQLGVEVAGGVLVLAPAAGSSAFATTWTLALQVNNRLLYNWTATRMRARGPASHASGSEFGGATNAW